ncbi:MAG: type VI secretion system tip protein VgrG, partial [Gemmatimonadota bacterium]|nr:type VI secretion system tip protein VgrG [Gemmatimonadota bacterium]
MALTQKGRDMRVDSPLGEDVLLLRSFEGTESVSKPFSFSLELLATRAVEAKELLRKPLTITLSRPAQGKERVIHGLVRSLTSRGRAGDSFAYRAEVTPWLWFLSLTRDCRVFQKKSAVEIVEEVFKGHGQTDYRIECTGAFPKRDYTVQYRESDLDFVSRLLEAEGIFYFFEHTKDAHQLVLADHQGAVAESPVQKEVEFRPSTEAHGADGIIDSFTVEDAIHTHAAVLDDYYYEKATADLRKREGGPDNATSHGEIYDYPGGYLEGNDGARLTRIRLEAEEARASTLGGFGNCIGLIPGFRFELQNSEEHKGEYLVLEVHHQSGVNDYVSETAKKPDYSNGFNSIPYATPYRPPRRAPIPVVHGAQTAVVVGPSGEEIYTDKYGRVKVLFHWDRVHKPDGESS